MNILLLPLRLVLAAIATIVAALFSAGVALRFSADDRHSTRHAKAKARQFVREHGPI